MGTINIGCIIISPTTKNGNFPVFNLCDNTIAVFNVPIAGYNEPVFKHSIVIQLIIRINALYCT